MTITNGTTSKRGRALPPGIYCPSITFYQPTRAQDLDLDVYRTHIENLESSGISGVVILGSNGEAVMLDREERKTLIRIAKEIYTAAGNPGSVIAGTGSAHSTREAILLCREAAEAGADFALVLPSSYYPGATDADAHQAFFEEVADESPIPIIIYSYPAVSSGIVLSTDLTKKLAKHPNIVGIKHTDHEVGRIAREVAFGDFGTPFTILGGASDYLIGTLAVGGRGAISGMANITPRVLAKIYDLFEAGKQAEALKLAGLISRSEWAIGKGGMLGTKHAIMWANSYPSYAALGRRPFPVCPPAIAQNVEAELAEVVALEHQLKKEGYAGQALATSNGDVIDTIKQKISAL